MPFMVFFFIVLLLLAFVIGLVRAAILFWYIVLPVAFSVAAYIFLRRAHARDMKLKEEEEARMQCEKYRLAEEKRREEQRWAEEKLQEELKMAEARRREEEAIRQYSLRQQAISQRLSGIITDTSSILQSLPKDIDVAEYALNEAEREFAEGAFAPFWDAVERAATNLARFDLGILQVRANSDSYKTEMKMLDSTPPPFPVNYTLPDVARTVDRMRCIVRLAQKDFHFATIYEQRKTNQLLVKGFTSLGQALNEMRHHIQTSIKALSGSISDLAASNKANAQALLVSSESLLDQLQYDADERRTHEEQEREMLDNIQRRRKPLS